jgi:NADPH-dependent ferric siderophore reductase
VTPGPSEKRVALVLDEMHAPTVAAALRQLSHDVVAVAAMLELRSLSDDDLFSWARSHGRRVVTENVKDYRRLFMQAEEAGIRCPGVLFTSSRIFPRSRRDPGPLIAALAAWLNRRDVHDRPVEDWLRPA